MRILHFLGVFQKGSMTPFVARKKHAKVLATNCAYAAASCLSHVMSVSTYNVQIVVLNHQNSIQGGPRGGTIKLTRAGKSHFCNREKSENQIKGKLGGFSTNEFL